MKQGKILDFFRANFLWIVLLLLGGSGLLIHVLTLMLAAAGCQLVSTSFHALREGDSGVAAPFVFLVGVLFLLGSILGFRWMVAWLILGSPPETGCYDPDIFFQRRWVEVSCEGV